MALNGDAEPLGRVGNKRPATKRYSIMDAWVRATGSRFSSHGRGRERRYRRNRDAARTARRRPTAITGDSGRSDLRPTATLSALTFNDRGERSSMLTPSFAPDMSGYAADVSDSIEMVTLTATATQSAATVADHERRRQRHAGRGGAGSQRRVKYADGDRNVGGRQRHEDPTRSRRRGPSRRRPTRR